MTGLQRQLKSSNKAMGAQLSAFDRGEKSSKKYGVMIEGLTNRHRIQARMVKQDVIEAVFDSQDPNLDMPKLEEDKLYQRAVIMLTTYYYENRMAISEVSQHESPFSVTHAIQTLRAHRDRYLCD